MGGIIGREGNIIGREGDKGSLMTVGWGRMVILANLGSSLECLCLLTKAEGLYHILPPSFVLLSPLVSAHFEHVDLEVMTSVFPF